MNLSNFSVYENVTPISKKKNSDESPEAVVISDICKVLNASGPVIFCPFCVSSFAEINGFETHLSSYHYSFLLELTGRSVRLDVCPFCPGKFFGHHLVAKHSLTYHDNVLINTFFSKSAGFIQCQFCSKLLGVKEVIPHLQDIHALEYDEWFKTKFNLEPGGIVGLVKENACPEKPMEIENLNGLLENMTMSPKLKSILKTPTSRENSVSKLPVRRVLRFEDDKENCVSIPHPNTPVAKLSRRRMSISANGTSWMTVIKASSFQCGKCSISFPSYQLLLLHVKREHKKLSKNLLKPMFQCALCGAKFFKSSCLKKHHALHSIAKVR